MFVAIRLSPFPQRAVAGFTHMVIALGLLAKRDGTHASHTFSFVDSDQPCFPSGFRLAVS
jgi:hypothetical protein